MRNAILTLVLALFVSIAWNSSTSALTAAAVVASPQPRPSSWTTGVGEYVSIPNLEDKTFPPGETTIDLRNTGYYDAERWMVIVEYRTFTVPAGSKVRFRNHDSRAPVVIRTLEEIEIHGELNLDGAPGHDHNQLPTFAEPGPGGFRGGTGYQANQVNISGGHGPGGGFSDHPTAGSVNDTGAGGSFATAGSVLQTGATYPNAGPTYGEDSVRALIGGSGGMGGLNNVFVSFAESRARGGGAGGGALLLGSDLSIHIDGRISARGGLGGNGGYTNGGSGGAIRLASPLITWGPTTIVGGNGLLLDAQDGSDANQALSGLGRVRVETNGPIASGGIPCVPAASYSAALGEFIPASIPTVTILAWFDSHDGVWRDIGQDPHAVIVDTNVDIKLPESGTHTLRIEGRGVPQGSVLHVRKTYTQGLAVIDSSQVMGNVGGAPNGALWSEVQVDFTPGISTVQVRAEFP